MEFNEKLQELRKSKGMTQEELAEALFVSRTAISKWESGRGYPNIDSLKEISKFFAVTIDELICPEEIISVAENEKKEYISKYKTLICSALDLLPAVLLFIPVFRNGGEPVSESLFAMTDISSWLKFVFVVIIGLMILNGFFGVIISNYDKPLWNRHRLITGMVLSVMGSGIFIMTRQPYAGIVCFAILVIKGVLLINECR